MQIEPSDLARLRSQASRAELILFTGAGFSLGARDRARRPLLSSPELKRELWNLSYPDDEFDPNCSLGDVYGAALRNKRTELSRLLDERFTVDTNSLPEYYKILFNFPWFRCYTLNVDDLESAVARRFSIERAPSSISAREGDRAGFPYSPEGLEVVHLNGLVPAAPEALSFSETQYAERIGNQEPWYSRCVVDITSRPVIFIGTVLNEPLLWHHMELRRRRENLGRDLRPTSILVARELSRPRRDILRDLRINWVEGTTEEFANQVLGALEIEGHAGRELVRRRVDARASDYIPYVSQLMAESPAMRTEYLLGDEPQWADITSGRAIERVHDDALLAEAERVLNGERPSTAIAITGTAGTGKSTALMSLAVKLTNNGIPVLWVDKNSLVTPAKMRSRVREAREKIVLAIDDADMYGKELNYLIRDLVSEPREFLLLFATRSSKFDAIAWAVRAETRVEIHEHVVPPLEDTDIDSLIGVLERNNRLGRLTGESPTARRAAFRDQAGRQLLVAMIQATSGENFERKAQEEYTGLEGAQRYAYALICVATSLRQSVTKDEVLLAYADSHEEALVALERLAARHLVLLSAAAAEYRGRHRVIADLVFEKLKELRELTEVLVGLCWALASKVGSPLDRHSRSGRFLVRLINHEFLLRTIGFNDARDLYTRLEPVLSGDYHYWLQRGSIEVEVGDVRRAENFLGAARSLGGGDFRVDTEYAYMLMRKAYEVPHHPHAEDILNSGIQELETIIEQSGHLSEYPYHVLGSQGLAWAHRAIAQNDARRTFLEKLLKTVEGGLKHHPRADNLLRLREDLRREILLTVAVR